jgi:hypothetical protein
MWGVRAALDCYSVTAAALTISIQCYSCTYHFNTVLQLHFNLYGLLQLILTFA